MNKLLLLTIAMVALSGCGNGKKDEPKPEDTKGEKAPESVQAHIREFRDEVANLKKSNIMTQKAVSELSQAEGERLIAAAKSMSGALCLNVGLQVKIHGGQDCKEGIADCWSRMKTAYSRKHALEKKLASLKRHKVTGQEVVECLDYVSDYVNNVLTKLSCDSTKAEAEAAGFKIIAGPRATDKKMEQCLDLLEE